MPAGGARCSPDGRARTTIANDDEIFKRLIRKLDRLGSLDRTDRHALRALPFKTHVVPANRVLVREGDLVASCMLLLKVYACRHQTTADGARQIVSFHLPRDILDLAQLHAAA